MIELEYGLVIDVGKTHVKIQVFNSELESVFSKQTQNQILNLPPYPHFNIDKLWAWMLGNIRDAVHRFNIGAISVTTHGATAALIDERQKAGNGLVLPVLDYEYSGLENSEGLYQEARPRFTQTFSPALPAGLNLGRQLFWLQHNYPKEFKSATAILLYPQYWAWRLSGVLATEVSSLGCHTDLWNPIKRDFSELVRNQYWDTKFPPLMSAWECLGEVCEPVREVTGLSPNCKIYTGVHDSNASYLRYKSVIPNSAFSVISTGTWAIVMAAGVGLESLHEQRDTLANVDVFANPVACSRSMGGREFARICELTGAPMDEPVAIEKLQQLIDQNIFALPDFSSGSGPLTKNMGKIIGLVPADCGAALASIYCALMLDYQLDLLGAAGDIILEGAFVQNVALCRLLAQLRPSQKLFVAAKASGTAQGCAQLAWWESDVPKPELHFCPALALHRLTHYKQSWRTSALAE